MSEKLNRATWLGGTGRNCCAVCLDEGVSAGEAKNCDGVHFHEFCGAAVNATINGLSCERGHPRRTIVGCVVKTKEEAVQKGVKW